MFLKTKWHEYSRYTDWNISITNGHMTKKCWFYNFVVCWIKSNDLYLGTKWYCGTSTSNGQERNGLDFSCENNFIILQLTYSHIRSSNNINLSITLSSILVTFVYFELSNYFILVFMYYYSFILFKFKINRSELVC